MRTGVCMLYACVCLLAVGHVLAGGFTALPMADSLGAEIDLPPGRLAAFGDINNSKSADYFYVDEDSNSIILVYFSAGSFSNAGETH
ncbi:hypothetical protein KIPB_013796 [Kipferlia bialata]|uniref:Uncharacterized protein n=1 Tax=Kipferlia bialata TaxID=797122 RepID=A0A391NSP9_9EUKA|nr:hypothetical protein KIPB_013796 [Kipferlia bialata]|eukprot:g13796.t1